MMPAQIVVDLSSIIHVLATGLALSNIKTKNPRLSIGKIGAIAGAPDYVLRSGGAVSAWTVLWLMRLRS